MARRYGTIYTAIWSDPDFRALAVAPQRLYLFLVSQPDLTYAGVLPVRPTGWAKSSAGYTATQLRKDLKTLEAKRFVVTDADTDELLIRTFVRNDELWKQPKMMHRLKSDVALIDSAKLLDRLKDELTRIPLEDASDKPTAGGGPSPRKVARAVIDEIVYGTHGPAGPPGPPTDTPADAHGEA